MLCHRAHRSRPGRRGAALLLSLLVLLVLVVIMSQLNIATVTDARVGRNDLSLTAMDLAIESSLLEVSETLAADAEGGGSEDAGGGDDPLSALGGGGDAGGLGGAGGEGEEEDSGSVDSRQDEWTTPIRTEINGIRLRILIQDEDSKLNVLTMLSQDEVEAQKAFERVVRVLDMCRQGTKADIEEGDARAMAEAMREHLLDRTNSFLPRPSLVTDTEDPPDLGLPLSLREFICLEGFDEDHFRDYYDEDGTVVHSIASFLTCFTAVTTRDEMNDTGSPGGPEDGPAAGDGGDPPGGADGGTGDQGGDGGDGDGGDGGEGAPAGGSNPGGDGGGSLQDPSTGTQMDETMGSSGGSGGGGGGSSKSGVAVNINTAPPAVLKALFDDRDVAPRFWDRVIEYRNEEDEEALEEDEDPPLDEFGDEIIVPKIFENLGTLEELDEFRDLDALMKGEVQNLLTTESHVFSIFVTARKPTGLGAGMDYGGTKDEVEEEERSGKSLSRTVRCTVWRREGADGWELVPLERWEVLDYMPFQVLDLPEEDR